MIVQAPGAVRAAVIAGPVAPVRSFAFEPGEARELTWMPLAVRFKLDQAGRRVRLAQWQQLPLASRCALLDARPGSAFEQLADRLFGAADGAALPSPAFLQAQRAQPDAGWLERADGLLPDARAWWRAAPLFQRYLSIKTLCVGDRASATH